MLRSPIPRSATVGFNEAAGKHRGPGGDGSVRFACLSGPREWPMMTALVVIIGLIACNALAICSLLSHRPQPNVSPQSEHDSHTRHAALGGR